MTYGTFHSQSQTIFMNKKVNASMLIKEVLPSNIHAALPFSSKQMSGFDGEKGKLGQVQSNGLKEVCL